MSDRATIDSPEWIVSDLIKESAAEATVPPQELPYVHLTADELKDSLEQHRVWVGSRGARGARFDFSRGDFQGLDFTGANLQGANLNKANFRGAELLLADLRGASLVQADMREANLLGTDFRGANLEGACLEGSAGLSTLRLARARLFSAVLPAAISIFEGDSTASIRMEKCYRSLTMMLAVTFLCFVRILTTRDIQFLRDAPTIRIPRLGALLPLSVFYLIVPVALFGMFLYLHLSLANLQESLNGLPAMFPDGHVAEQRGTWLVTELVKITESGSSERWSWSSFRLQSIIATLLAYWSVPAILLLFWGRYLVMQDLHASMMHILLIVLSVGVAAVLPQLMKSSRETPALRAPSMAVDGEESVQRAPEAAEEMRAAAPENANRETSSDVSDGAVDRAEDAEAFEGTELEALEAKVEPVEDQPARSGAKLIERRERSRVGTAGGRAVGIGCAGLLLAMLTFGVVYGAPTDATARDLGKASIRRWSSGVFWALGYAPYARLNESTVSALPAKWSWRDEDLQQVKGPELNKLRLRYAQGYRTTWVNAHLWKADLRGAYLSDSDFRGANLRETNLRAAQLDHSRLYKANLQSAELDGANFTRADLRETDLSYAQMGNSILVDAQVGHSNLFRADLHEARLDHSNLQNADLRDANLAGASLRLANVQDAYLWSAKLGGADLSDARGPRAILIEADLQGANLRQANLRGAIMRGANLTGADLSGADLREVSGLSAEQICSGKAHAGALMEDGVAAEVAAQCGGSGPGAGAQAGVAGAGVD
jgi:uncharacterized protein YjbI with pentapeptide repeats